MFKSRFSYFLHNKKRTSLSLIGIALGVFSLVFMMSITGAMKVELLKALGKMGDKAVVVLPGDVKNFGGRTMQISFYTTLTLKDAKSIKSKCPMVSLVSPFKKVTPSVHANGIFEPATVYGVSPLYWKIAGIDMRCGRFIQKKDVDNISEVAVIGSDVAEDLFNSSCPVGKTIYLYDAPYRIVGVVDKMGTDVSGENLDEMIYIPISSAVKRISNVDYIDGIYILPINVKKAIKEVNSLLLKLHGKRDFSVSRYEDVVNTKKEALAIFSKLSITVSAVAFSVGALGIFALMMLSIYERLIEIGIRRSFGATRRNIFSQFLIESASISMFGAFIGITLAEVLSLVVCLVAKWSFYIPYTGILISILLSVVIGILSGVYPAVKATAMDTKDILKEV